MDLARFLQPDLLVGHGHDGGRSGFQSPMSQSCDTTRVPGLSDSSAGRSCRLTSGSRYMVTTVAGDRSVLNRSCSRKRTRSATPAFAASRLLCAPVGHDLDAQPGRTEALGGEDHDAAVARTEIDDVVGGPTSAMRSISSVTLSAEVMKGNFFLGVCGVPWQCQGQERAMLGKSWQKTRG